MTLIRVVVERLLLLVLRVAQGVFILQGLAFGCASVAVLAVPPLDTPGWLRGVGISALVVSVLFFVAGLLLVAERRWLVARTSDGGRPASLWPLLLGVSLIALPVAAALAASGLPALWSRIADQLAAIGFWDGIARSDPYGGIVLLPIMVALAVPALVTAAAVFAVAFSLALIPLLTTRSRLFPTLLAMGATCQAILVIAGWIAVDALARFASQALATMADSGDAEVLRVAADLEWATGVLTRTAIALVAPTIGLLGWAAFLRPSGARAAYFWADNSPATWAAPATESTRVTGGAAEGAPLQPGVGARLARGGLAALGVLMLLFAAGDVLRTRPVYERSQPASGATVARAPRAVRVTFGAALDPSSSIYVIRMGDRPVAGDSPRDVTVTRRLAPDDPERRTLEALPADLPSGVYRVNWLALPAGGGVARHGSFSFGVGAAVPTDGTHALLDRDAGARGRRQTVAGGVLLLLLGALLPRLSLVRA